MMSAPVDQDRVAAILADVRRRTGSGLDGWMPSQQGAVGHLLGLTDRDGARLALKVYGQPSRAATEATALQVVADLADVPAPRLIAAGPDWVLMTRLPGQRWADHRDRLDDAGNQQIAVALWAAAAAAHTKAGTSYGGLAGLERSADTRATSLRRRARTVVSDLVAGGAPERLVGRIRTWLTDRVPTRTDGVVPVLCHHDLTGGNALIDAAGRIVGVLDWERAGWDDPLVDLAQLVQHVRTHAPGTVPALVAAAGVTTPDERDRLAVHVVLNAAAERAWVSADRPANAAEALARLDALLADLTM